MQTPIVQTKKLHACYFGSKPENHEFIKKSGFLFFLFDPELENL